MSNEKNRKNRIKYTRKIFIRTMFDADQTRNMNL